MDSRASVSGKSPAWVNGEITLTVPLGVAPSASNMEKQDAVTNLLEEVLDKLPPHLTECVSGKWEVVDENGDPT